MYNSESENHHQDYSSSECFKNPDSNFDSRIYSDIEADFNLDNFPNEREYNNSYSNINFSGFEDLFNLEISCKESINVEPSFPSFSSLHLGNMFLDENFDNSMDSNQVKSEPFEQNIDENNNNNNNENPLNSFVLDI